MLKQPILVIDDDPQCCELVTVILRKADFKVVAASDGPSGIELARATQPVVILLDIVMPGVDGIEVCQQLKQDPVLRHIPVVGITSSDDLTFTRRVFRAGAGFFLPKPFQAATLLRVVDLALARLQQRSQAPCRRRQPRLASEVPVRCLVGESEGSLREVAGKTGNVSLDGLLLFLPEKLGQGAVVRLKLDLPDGAIAANGTVMWQGPQAPAGFRHGFRLLGFKEDADIVRYRRFLSQLAAVQRT